MALKNQKFFQQRLGGKTVIEILQELTYSSDKVEDRLNEVQSILESEEFFVEYLENHFTANINAGDALSQDINVFSAIETLASYILNSKEIKKQEDSEITKYEFITNRSHFEKKVNREWTGNGEADGTIAFLKGSSKNQKKSKDIVIENSDLKSSTEMGAVLRAYQAYKDLLVIELRKIKLRGSTLSKKDIEIFQSWSDRACRVYGKIDPSILTQNEIDQGLTYDRLVFKDPEDLKIIQSNKKDISRTRAAIIIGQLSDDMIFTKKSYTGVWAEDLKNFYESTEPDYRHVDLTNFDHVYGFEKSEIKTLDNGETIEIIKHTPGLMFFENNYEVGTEMYLTFMMLEDAIKKAKMTDNQRSAFKLVQRGYSTKMIAEELGIDHQNVNRTLKSAAAKVVKACIELNYGLGDDDW